MLFRSRLGEKRRVGGEGDARSSPLPLLAADPTRHGHRRVGTGEQGTEAFVDDDFELYAQATMASPTTGSPDDALLHFSLFPQAASTSSNTPYLLN